MSSKLEKTACICWETLTGKTGNGSPMPRGDAQRTADKLNSQYPEIVHWIVPAKETRW